MCFPSELKSSPETDYMAMLREIGEKLPFVDGHLKSSAMNRDEIAVGFGIKNRQRFYA